MKKTDIFFSYLKGCDLSKHLFPIDMYFIQNRAKSNCLNQKSMNQTKKINGLKPNILTKISYKGNVHFLPTSGLSQIINFEKII